MNFGRTPRTIAAGFAVVVFCFAARTAQAAISILDQYNSIGGNFTASVLTNGQSAGQSFTPSLSAIDFFGANLFSAGVSTVQLSLLAGTNMIGTPIATSPSYVLTNLSVEPVEFRFPSTVALTPGIPYTARLDLLAGDSYRLEFSLANPYPLGFAFDQFNRAVPTVDWVFWEGLAPVPEPSFSLLIGGTLLVLARRLRPRFSS